MALVSGFSTDLNYTLKSGDKTIKQYSNNQIDVAAKTAMKIFNGYSSEHTFETKIKMACVNGLLILVGGDAFDKVKMCCNKIWDGYQEACQFYSEQEKVVNPPKDDFDKQCYTIVEMMFFKIKLENAIKCGLEEYYTMIC